MLINPFRVAIADNRKLIVPSGTKPNVTLGVVAQIGWSPKSSCGLQFTDPNIMHMQTIHIMHIIT